MSPETLSRPDATIEAKDTSPPSSASSLGTSDDEAGAPLVDASVKLAMALSGATPESIAGPIEALLLSVDRPVPAARLAEALGLIQDADDPSQAESDEPAATDATKPKKRGKKGPVVVTPVGLVHAAIEHLNAGYQQTARSFRIQRVAGGYRVMTLPEFSGVLERFHGKRERHGVSRAALETLAIIAYKQPITRASLEAIRGVACGEVLRSLIERRLVTIVGRAEELGRPMLYGTTKSFLETFGLASVKDLPAPEEFRPRGEDPDAD
ncbi:MAG: SMC-Scp complex subunit ScpB [Phycisphaerales bacterium]|nr:SMC-Scp complex subunit ScpB [Phycisphaerales bacterium]